MFNKKNTIKIQIKEINLLVEPVESLFSKIIGLMFRKSLGENQGMLFIFDKPGIYKIWNMFTLIPLDVIFISEDMVIVGIEKLSSSIFPSQTVCSYLPAKYVLEVNSNFAKENNIAIGDKLAF